MSTVRTLFPDASKLEDYSSHINLEKLQLATEGILFTGDYFYEDYYLRLADKFEKCCKDYELESHYDNLLLLINIYNERLTEHITLLEENYDDDKTSQEVTKFLHNIITAKPTDFFRISIKTNETTTISNNKISKWMADLIIKAIEFGDVPIEILGTGRLSHDIYGSGSWNKRPLSVEHLAKSANSSVKNPVYLIRDHIYNFSIYLRPYLETHTHLKREEHVKKLSNQQADFYYDLFVILGYIPANREGGLDRNYMHDIFKKYKP